MCNRICIGYNRMSRFSIEGEKRKRICLAVGNYWESQSREWCMFLFNRNGFDIFQAQYPVPSMAWFAVKMCTGINVDINPIIDDEALQYRSLSTSTMYSTSRTSMQNSMKQ